MIGSPVKNGGLIFMTTHYEKIQALGNRMASNLETMGVSASFSDGGLTLADKILEIQQGFTDGLLLYADKNIIQTGDTVNLYALLLENGKAVSGETIFFDGILTTPTRVTLQEAEYYLTTKYDVITIPEGGVLYLDSARSIHLTHPVGADYFSLVSLNHVIDTGTDFSMNNGILTYTDSNNNTKTADLTYYGWSNIYPSIAECVIDDYSCYAVTGSNGVATVGYVGKGTGHLNIRADIDGIIQSETYSIIDALAYDDGTATISDYWNNTSALTRNDDGTTTFSASGWTKSNFKVNNASTIAFNEGRTVEFDVIEINGSPRINGNDGSERGIILSATGHHKVVFEDNVMSVSVNGTLIESIAFDTSVSSFTVGFRSGSSSSTVKFDNFLLY